MNSTKALVKRLERLGYPVEQRNGHLKVRDPEGKLIVTMASTPSDHRALKNTVALLKAAGVPLREQHKRRKGSASEHDADMVRGRLQAVLNGGTPLAEFARRVQAAGKTRGAVAFSSDSSAANSMRVFLDGGGMTKARLDLVSAALRAVEGRPAKPEILAARVEAEEPEQQAIAPAPNIASAGLELIGAARRFLDVLETQLKDGGRG